MIKSYTYTHRPLACICIVKKNKIRHLNLNFYYLCRTLVKQEERVAPSSPIYASGHHESGDDGLPHTTHEAQEEQAHLFSCRILLYYFLVVYYLMCEQQ